MPKNAGRAFDYYLKATEFKDPFAFLPCALYFLFHDKKYSQAFNLLKNPPEKKVAQRNFWFGFCLINGIGTSQKFLDGYELIFEVVEMRDLLVAQIFISSVEPIRRRFS